MKKDIRGSKYSFKHISLKPKDPKFWDFSLDEHIAIDLPTMLEYILNETGAPKISYIGFSQGTALGFGALALHPKLASRVNLMIALASTALVRGLYGITLKNEDLAYFHRIRHNPLIDAITRARPELVFLMFGRFACFSSYCSFSALSFDCLENLSSLQRFFGVES